ncbi:hypothetical protein DIURU_000105 [Diutina rugosa]|uniref:Chloride channel protein n=1 Tax=Diutina rugosa TaxID=5481 RepID=A0A642V141_DIURU|nr:uncharacterized protein DIURU_000105 [Diutina rugosa]KAA8908562.1 hypothetical protein DIURU_000105 [Diutina rugosa]
MGGHRHKRESSGSNSVSSGLRSSPGDRRPLMSHTQAPTTPKLELPGANEPFGRYRSRSKLGTRSPMAARITPGGWQGEGSSLLSGGGDPDESFYSSYSAINTFIRGYYNDFTTIDGARAYILTNRFNYGVKKRVFLEDCPDDIRPMPWYYVVYYTCGKWVLIGIISLLFSLIAFSIDKIEILLVGAKYGYCNTNWFASQVTCCDVADQHDRYCPQWVSWSDAMHSKWMPVGVRFDYVVYVVLSILLAWIACEITLTTKIVGGSTLYPENGDSVAKGKQEPRVMYTACGSGVPEVKTILSGFVIRRFLGTYTLFTKAIGLVFAIASGMCLGKEGPYVHLATCVGNISSRLFPYIHNNDSMRKQILSAAASAGVALAFGSPLGGVLFILEEINHYLPSHQLFQIFVCAIVSTLFLKFLNPYGTGKTVLFELSYDSDWRPLELVNFVVIGVAGGLFGAAFIKFTFWWPTKFRQIKLIKNHPAFEVVCVAALTGLVTYWNPYTKQASSELVLDLATPCSGERDRSLCPGTETALQRELGSLVFAFVVKVVLTFVTFGLKVPCGVYVPSMVAGALFGRIFSMAIQGLHLRHNLLTTSNNEAVSALLLRYVCSPDRPECVDMGIYSMISAGAFMAGVTRMNITLVTILFELTSSYTYVLPIAVAISVANWAGGLIEPHSLYEKLLITNDYPFMTSENEAVDPYVTAGEIITDRDTVDVPQEVVTEVDMDQRIFRRLSVITSLATNADDKLYIDVSESPYVAASYLGSKLALLAEHHSFDGCLPLVRNGLCVGLIHYSELDFCLDQLREFAAEYHITDEIHCLVVDDNDRAYHKKRAIIAQQVGNNYAIVSRVVEGGDDARDYFTYGATAGDMDSPVAILMAKLTNLVPYIDHSPIFLNYDSEMSFANMIFDRLGNRVIVLLREGKYYGILHKKVLIDYCRRGA